jgi:hypothetical protein
VVCNRSNSNGLARDAASKAIVFPEWFWQLNDGLAKIAAGPGPCAPSRHDATDEPRSEGHFP